MIQQFVLGACGLVEAVFVSLTCQSIILASTENNRRAQRITKEMIEQSTASIARKEKPYEKLMRIAGNIISLAGCVINALEANNEPPRKFYLSPGLFLSFIGSAMSAFVIKRNLQRAQEPAQTQVRKLKPYRVRFA